MDFSVHGGGPPRVSFKDAVCLKALLGIQELRTLTELSLGLIGNQLGDDSTAALGAGLAHLHQLSRVDLGLTFNDIGQKGARALAAALRRLLRLKTVILYLRHNVKVGEQGAEALAEVLIELPELAGVYVNLEECGVSREFGDAIAKRLDHVMERGARNMPPQIIT